MAYVTFNISRRSTWVLFLFHAIMQFIHTVHVKPVFVFSWCFFSGQKYKVLSTQIENKVVFQVYLSIYGISWDFQDKRNGIFGASIYK